MKHVQFDPIVVYFYHKPSKHPDIDYLSDAIRFRRRIHLLSVKLNPILLQWIGKIG